MFIFYLLFLFFQCCAQPGGDHKLFDPLSCYPEPDGRVKTLAIGPEKLEYVPCDGGYRQKCDDPQEDAEIQEKLAEELKEAQTWDAYKVDVAALFAPDDKGCCGGVVLPSVGFTEKFVVDSNSATLDELQKNYPDAFYVSCLRGGIPIQEVARRRGINVHLGLLSSRDVTEQRGVLCDFDMLPWDKIKEHGNTIVFWDDITDTGQTAAEFLYWCHKRGKLADGVKVVLAFNHGKDGHPHKKGDVNYGYQDGEVLDDATMRGRIIRRLVEVERLDQKMPLDKAFVESEGFRQKFQEWEDFFDKTVEKAFFTEYLGGQWVVFPAEGGNPLIDDKPDTDVMSVGENYDVLLGCPIMESCDERLHILTQQSLLSNITDELLNMHDVGYVFADAQNKGRDGKERLVFKYNRDLADRVLCYAQVAGYEKPQADFAEMIRERCGYKSTLAVPGLSKEVFRPYPLSATLRPHTPVRQVYQIQPKKGETLRTEGDRKGPY